MTGRTRGDSVGIVVDGQRCAGFIVGKPGRIGAVVRLRADGTEHWRAHAEIFDPRKPKQKAAKT